eukprot:1923587-Rhodomonas_salina.2
MSWSCAAILGLVGVLPCCSDAFHGCRCYGMYKFPQARLLVGEVSVPSPVLPPLPSHSVGCFVYSHCFSLPLSVYLSDSCISLLLGHSIVRTSRHAALGHKTLSADTAGRAQCVWAEH